MKTNFVAAVGDGYHPDPEGQVLDSLFSQYERVIVESIVTSFGMDFLLFHNSDQHGGDVDTILNVRKIGKDPRMTYKSSSSRTAYDAQIPYSRAVKAQYDSDRSFISLNAAYSAQKKAGDLVDSYTGKKVARNADIDLDHVISTEEIHRDRGRVLAGLNGIELANSPENLRPTDRSINRSMKEKPTEKYLGWLKKQENWRRARITDLRGKKTLTDKERAELHKLEAQDNVDPVLMQQADQAARNAYNAKLSAAYYTSPAFAKNVANAAGKVGLRMGARQVFGFIFMEIWFAVKEEFNKIDQKTGFNMESFLNAVANGVQRGGESAKLKYRNLIERFGEGVVAGALSSVTTTLCNIFFTTAKNVVRVIRQTYASLVEACKILFINPDCLPFELRMQAAAKVLATGASVVVGSAVQDALQKTPVGSIPELGNVICVFCGTAVTGIMSCSLLYLLDHSETICKLVQSLAGLDFVDKEAAFFRECAEYFEQYAAQLEKIDLKKFRQEIAVYQHLADRLEMAQTEDELNTALKNALTVIGVRIPWGDGSFDAFMRDRSRVMVFE